MLLVPSTLEPAANSSMLWQCHKCGSCNTTNPKRSLSCQAWKVRMAPIIALQAAKKRSFTIITYRSCSSSSDKNTHPNIVPTCNHKSKSPQREMQKKRRSTTAHASDDVELPPSSLPSLSLPLLLWKPTTNPKLLLVPRLLPRPPSSEVALCPLLPWYCVKLSWNVWFRYYQHVLYLEKVFFWLGYNFST